MPSRWQKEDSHEEADPPRQLADEPDKAAELAVAPLSLTAGDGRQFIFRQPIGKAWRNTAGRIAPHVDTRADGGYIVAPPSVLGGNKAYRWAKGMSLDDEPEGISLAKLRADLPVVWAEQEWGE